MLLKDKVAVIYGGGGVIGGVIAEACARAGARIFLAGRTRPKLEAVARRISSFGGEAQIGQVDALDTDSVERHADGVVARAGRIDIAVNAVGVAHVQGKPLAELTVEEYAYPVSVYTRTHFITAKAVARHMAPRGSGVILALSTPAGRMTGPGYLGHCVACAGIEALTGHLAGELGPSGIRVLCLRSHAIPEVPALGSHCREVFGQVSERAGISIDEMMAGAASSTPLRRLPTLGEVANTAVFLVSPHAGAMTGAIANLTCGFVLD